jgi:hypothetical protein
MKLKDQKNPSSFFILQVLIVISVFDPPLYTVTYFFERG